MNFNEFYDCLTPLEKSIFKEMGYEPNNYIDANNAIKSFYDINNKKPLKVSLDSPLIKKDGTSVSVIEISPNNFMNAFIPKVWNKLTLKERLKAVSYTYDFFVSQNTQLMHNKPKLLYINPHSATEYQLACFDSSENHIVLSLNALNDGKQNSLSFPGIIAHELQHAKQYLARKSYENINLKSLSIEQQAIFFSRTGACNHVFNTLLKSDLLASCAEAFEGTNLTDEDYKLFRLINSLGENDRRKLEIQVVQKLFYLAHPMERNSYKKQEEIDNLIVKQLKEEYPYETFENFNNNEFEKGVNILKKYLGYELSENDLDEIAKLNFILSSAHMQDDSCLYSKQESFDIWCNGLDTLMDLYKNKKLTKNIDYVDYDDFLKRKETQLKNNTRQNQENEFNKIN